MICVVLLKLKDNVEYLSSGLRRNNPALPCAQASMGSTLGFLDLLLFTGYWQFYSSGTGVANPGLRLPCIIFKSSNISRGQLTSHMSSCLSTLTSPDGFCWPCKVRRSLVAQMWGHRHRFCLAGMNMPDFLSLVAGVSWLHSYTGIAQSPGYTFPRVVIFRVVIDVGGQPGRAWFTNGIELRSSKWRSCILKANRVKWKSRSRRVAANDLSWAL